MPVDVMSYNPCRLYRYPNEAQRWAQAEQIIREVNPHVLMVQELNAPDQDTAVESAERLAEATGLRCKLDDGTYTIIKGNKSNYAIGIMWRPDVAPDVEPVVGSWRTVQPKRFFHGLGILGLKFDGIQIDAAVYHGPPVARRTDMRQVHKERVTEARLVADELTGPDANPFTMKVGDANTASADLLHGRYYDKFNFPAEDHPEHKWLTLQRRAGEIFIESGLIDVVPALAAQGRIGPWQPTVGHWETSRAGERRIDIFRVTRDLLPAVESYAVIDDEMARATSDHLAVVTRFNIDILRAIQISRATF